MRLRFGYLAVVVAAVCGSMLGASAQTTITVSPTVLRPARECEPLGVNNFGDGGATHYAAGNLLTNAGFEPIRMRELYRVIDSGEENGHSWASLDGPGTSRWLLYTSGTYSGAAMRAYRFVDGKGQPLPYKDAKWAQGGKLLDTATAVAMVPLFTTRVLPKGTPDFPLGGWLAPAPDTFSEWQTLSPEKKQEYQQGWRVYYEAHQPLRMDDVVIFERNVIWPDAADFHPRVATHGVASGNWTTLSGSARQIPIPADAPAAMQGGQGVLEMTATDGQAEIWQKIFGASGRQDAFWYGTLESGVKYRYEAWVEEVGATGGTVTLGFGSRNPGSSATGYFGNTTLVQTFATPAKWQKVGFEFTAPPTPAKGDIEGAGICYTGTGKLLIDNVKLQPVYQRGDEDKPFVVEHKLLAALLDSQPATGHKGAARIWFGLNAASMTSLCDWNAENSAVISGDQLAVATQSVLTLPKALSILDATGDAPETRMVPWLITQVTHTEDEYRQLVEYLAAPYDPAKDTPQSKPMAWRRVQQRGNTRPWTDDFREIIIEFGNENWHNRMNQSWLGLGRFGNVHGAGREYGLWGAYMIDVMRKNPYWNSEKLHICFGGNYTAKVNADGTLSGYGLEATVAAQGANDYHSHATYIGPRWETGEKSQTTIGDAGVQKTLFSYRLEKVDEWASQAAGDTRLHDMGFKTRLSAYEGGPTGFGLNAASPAEDRTAEYYGKSCAMGVTALDSWLDAWEKGWTYQCYLSFGQGKWWNSHTSFSQGFRPSPAWIIETLINHTMANRDLLKVRVDDSPTLTAELPRSANEVQRNMPVKTRVIPVIQAHAAGDAHYVAVAVVNLDLTQPHPVTMRVPMPSVDTITRYYLKGDPRDTNLDAEKVVLGVETLAPTALKDGMFTMELAPGSATVYVFATSPTTKSTQ